MASADYIALCQRFLSKADAALLDYCTLDPAPPELTESQDSPTATYAQEADPLASEFINAWRNWERVLRLNLTRYRSARLRREGAALVDPPDFPVEAVNAAKTAVSFDSPLEAELFLNKARWDIIEDFQGYNYFSITSIYAYLLKLLLLERQALFKAEEGFAEYKELYAAIVDASTAGGAPKRDESGEPK